MVLLTKVKTYLGIADTSKDAVLQLLIDDAAAYAVNYCDLSVYDSQLDSAVFRMVLQDYTRLGSQGIAAQSYSGASEQYLNGYSEDIHALLRKYRKVKFY